MRTSWVLSGWHRHRHPELWDMYLEPSRARLALKHLVERHWNCVDVGAHIGSVLVQLLHLAPEGRHIAFEPSPQKAAWLKARFPMVEVHQAALGSEAGHADFYDDLDRLGYSGLGRRDGVDARTNVYRVPVETLDEVMGDRQVHFVKLDVEGGELPVLKGASATLQLFRPALLFECGPEPSLAPFGYDRADLHRFLAVETGYEVYSVADFVYGRPPMSSAEFRKAGIYPFRGFDYLALPAGTPVARLL